MPNKPHTEAGVRPGSVGPTRIMGIDPGYDRLGVAIIERRPERTAGKRSDVVIYSACIETSSSDRIYERLEQIGRETSLLMDEYEPTDLAIETLFITKNQKTAMRVAEARGIILYEATKRGIPIHEYGPMEIKSAVAGDGSADKARMTKMVSLLVDVPEKRRVLDDEYDAIAVALARTAHSGRPGARYPHS